MKPSSTMPVGDFDPRFSSPQPEKPDQTPPLPESEEPISQNPQKQGRTWTPLWFKQLPMLRFNKQPEKFELLDPDRLKELLKDTDPAVRDRIMRDIHYLDHNLLRLFRELDYKASMFQNSYRLLQIAYMGLALLATIVGSLLALSLQGAPELTPYLGGLEAVIAGITTYFATINVDEPPQQHWLKNRMRAEFMRREYFRYLMNLEPYTNLEDYARKALLSNRAANIYRGTFPDSNSPMDAG